MRASSEAGRSALLQCSQVGRSSSITASGSRFDIGLAPAFEQRRQPLAMRFTRSAPAFSGEPESKGRLRIVFEHELDRLGDLLARQFGCDREAEIDAGRHATAEMRLRSRTTRSATGMAPKSFSMSRHAQWQADL